MGGAAEGGTDAQAPREKGTGAPAPREKGENAQASSEGAEKELEPRTEKGPERERKLRMYFFRKTYNASDRAILVRFYRSALEGFVTSWIMDGMKSDLTYEVERLLELLKPLK